MKKIYLVKIEALKKYQPTETEIRDNIREKIWKKVEDDKKRAEAGDFTIEVEEIN